MLLRKHNFFKFVVMILFTTVFNFERGEDDVRADTQCQSFSLLTIKGGTSNDRYQQYRNGNQGA